MRAHCLRALPGAHCHPLLSGLLKTGIVRLSKTRDNQVSNVPAMQGWRPEFRSVELKKKSQACLWSHPERVETKADRSLKLSWISELQVQGEFLTQKIKIRSNEGEWPEVALCPSHMCTDTPTTTSIHHTYSITCTPQITKFRSVGILYVCYGKFDRS